MARPLKNLRLFVAIHPPPALLGSLQAAVDALPGLPPRRTVPAEQVHLTLPFIGDTPMRAIEDTIESVARAASGVRAMYLEPTQLISLPRRGHARLIAVETDAPPLLLELQRRLARRLANVRRRADDRFLPHLTLCRFRAPTRMEPITRQIELPEFRVDRIRLMRSTLRAEGAEHHEVAEFMLPGK